MKQILSFALVIIFVAACASSGNVSIQSRAAPPSEKINSHIVEPGDTLYSVAWRYEIDYKRLAQINRISAPYTIHRGQRLMLSGPAIASSPAAVSVPASVARPSASSDPVPKIPAVPASVDGWNWPLQGKVVTSFGRSSLIKGITIDSSSQAEVKAAADGVVVYAGSGVRGYGNFLILKHSDLYLSAYAYNDELIASEGDQVQLGQKIAVSGKDMDGEPRLYFEIRKDGNPVDPIRYLPKR